MADNPDGAHLRGLNANMIQSIDVSENVHVDTLHHDDHDQLTDANEQMEGADQIVGRVYLFRDI